MGGMAIIAFPEINQNDIRNYMFVIVFYCIIVVTYAKGTQAASLAAQNRGTRSNVFLALGIG